MDHERAFRDYVTRVSFSLHMSRNQVATLRGVVLDIEAHDPSVKWEDRHPGLDGYRDTVVAAKANGLNAADIWVPGIRYLLSTGLIRETKAWAKQDAASREAHAAGKRFGFNWSLPHYEMTEAGAHVVGLLRIAGLIPMPAANVNRKRKRRVA